VDGDGFEADEVVATGDGAWDGGCPAAVLVDHLASAPCTIVSGAGQETGFIDFEL